MDGASAFIERNLIANSLKANIAYGGSLSKDTTVLNNDIYGSRCEGIFIIDGGFSWIWKNKIHDNSDGIIVADSSPSIYNNFISNNNRCGIILTSSSYPALIENELSNNYTCGLLVKENSYGDFKNNIVNIYIFIYYCRLRVIFIRFL